VIILKTKILNKNDIGKLIIELSEDYNFYAPLKNENGILIFDKVFNIKDVILDYFNSKFPPKEILFPRTEELFKFKTDGKNIIEIINQPRTDIKNIIFGIRGCDAHAFNLMEKFFKSGNFQDDLFLIKKQNSILIGIGCNLPKSTCFCTSVGGDPFNKNYTDIFLSDLGDKYLFEIISDAGKKLLDKIEWLVDAKESDIKNAENLAKKSRTLFKQTLDLKDINTILDNQFNNTLWNSLTNNCIGCGNCAFICPTCTCFDVIDEFYPSKNIGRRIRVWDSCQFDIYTLHASGHNPRNNKIPRFRNRILHKFLYYPLNYGFLGCVGCGRCIQICPANNDLRNTLQALKLDKINKEKMEVKK